MAAPATTSKTNAADEQSFKEFEQIVADFGPSEKVQAWEAFLQKYPNSSYVPKVREILAELKGEKHPAVVAAATPVPVSTHTNDPDLDFLNEPVKPTPTPRQVAVATPAPTPRPLPRPTPAAVASNSFMDSGSTAPAKSDRFSWNDAGSSGSERPTESVAPPRSFEPPRPRTRPSSFEQHGIASKYHFEVAPFFAFAPDETYVRNLLVGAAVSEHLGRNWSLTIEGASSQSSETPLLQSLRKIDAEPEIISKYNFIAGGMLGVNLLSAMNPVSNAIDSRNDLFLEGGGGVVNTNVEICKQTGGTKCAAPLFVDGVNFTWAGAGVGHRFYFTHHLLFRTEVRGRVVFELVDGKSTPRPNVQINLGPSFLF